MKIPARDRCLICDDDSDLIRSAAKTYQGTAPSNTGTNTWYVDWVLAAGIKVHSNRKEMDSDDLELLLV